MIMQGLRCCIANDGAEVYVLGGMELGHKLASEVIMIE